MADDKTAAPKAAEKTEAPKAETPVKTEQKTEQTKTETTTSEPVFAPAAEEDLEPVQDSSRGVGMHNR